MRLIKGLLSLLVVLTFTVANSQTLQEASDAWNKAAEIKDTDIDGAITKIEECLRICDKLGEEGADLKAQAEGVLPSMHYSAGKAKLDAKDYDGAIEKFEKTLEVATKYNSEGTIENTNKVLVQLYTTKSKLAYKDKDYDGTMAFTEKALAIDAEYLDALFMQGLAHKKKDDNEKYIANLEKVIELGDENDKTVKKSKSALYKTYLSSGGKMINGQKFEEGVTELDKAKALDEDEKLYFYYSVAYTGLSKWDEALEAANKAKELDTKAKLTDKIDKQIEIIKKAKEGN